MVKQYREYTIMSIIPTSQARPGVLGIRYLGPFYFRYMVLFGQNLVIKYLVFPEFYVFDI